MILFQVNTPSQLINASVLATTKFRKKTCHIYYTDNLKEAALYLTQANVFAKAYEITLVQDVINRKSKLNRAIVRIKNALDWGKIKKSLPSDPKKYSRIFVSGVSLRNWEIYYAIKSFNPKAKMSIFEEGIYEYCELGIRKEYLKIIFSYFFFHRFYLCECDSAYLYRPDLAGNNWKNITLKTIPCLKEQKDLIPLISKAFKYEPTQLSDASGKYVILEQASERDNDRQLKLIKSIVSVVGNENVLIKLHPRSEKNKYGDSFNYLNTQLPFEIIALNENIENNVFISVCSSSVINFKLILNMEPNIFMLFKVIRGLSQRETEDANDHFFESVKHICEKNNFFIPNSEKEFIEILSKINNS